MGISSFSSSLQFFAELVFRLVREKLTELATGRHKALAGIVMTTGEARAHTNTRTHIFCRELND